ncbi:MAG: TIGR01212 family radical SAM protein [Lachnospiraceae bacterium]|nr:TIGR01212 family radical SAM protein [Lachnospiraceae bacterium]
MEEVYYRYSKYLKQKYKEKTYKLPISLPISCPNRENGGRGCIYCGISGAGFENLGAFSVTKQLEINKNYIGEKYKANKFIAYFQSFTNTYMPLSSFKAYIKEAAIFGVSEIAVSTRPDCISFEYLDALKEIKFGFGTEITIELGLQSVNLRTLKNINRGHSIAEYIDAVLRIKEYGFQICTHLILNLPWDEDEDAVEAAKIISALGTDFVKLHALYIEKGTELAALYEKGELFICSFSEYEERVMLFLRYLSPDIAVERLIGRAPLEDTLFANWGMSWWKIHDEICAKMLERGICQGDLFDYLGGKAVKEYKNM